MRLLNETFHAGRTGSPLLRDGYLQSQDRRMVYRHGSGSQLVFNVLDIAISKRTVRTQGIVHTDHGVQFASQVFIGKDQGTGLMPSLGSVANTVDNPIMESFWSSRRNRLLNCECWTTLIALSNIMFEYIEILNNRRRGHSELVCDFPTKHEYTHHQEAT